jgi:hypothetical protein
MASPADSLTPSPRGTPVWPLAVALLLVVVAGALLWNAELVNDVAWQIWVARQLAHGITLYTDIVEVNPPLWFWAAIPIVDLAQLLGVSSYHVLIPSVLALDIIALLLVRALCRDLQSGRLIVLGFPVITLLAFLDVFGQREHLTLIAIVPYLILVARRAEGLAASRTIAILCGILAAFGIALKPYFLLVPVVLEILLLVRTRRLPFRPENLALAGSLVAYALSVLLFARAYFVASLPMLMIYQGDHRPIAYLLAQPVATMTCLLLLSLALYGRPRSSIAQAALIAGLAFLAAYFLQGKGWRYHGVPAMGCFAFAIVAEAERLRRDALSLAARAGVALAMLTIICLAVPLVQEMRTRDHANALLATSDLHPGDVVAALSGSAYWPVPEERHFIWPSRSVTYSPLFYAVEASRAKQPNPAMATLIADIRRGIVHDLACNPPRRILGDRYDNRYLKIGLVEFLSTDPDFARLMRAYRRGPDYGEFTTYDRVGQIADHPPTCRAIY